MPRGGLPVGDIMLAQKIVLELFESEAIRPANRSPMRDDVFEAEMRLRILVFAAAISLSATLCAGDKDIAETLFGKMARTFLRHIRVHSWQELRDRILKGIAEINACPVFHRWKKFEALTALTQ